MIWKISFFLLIFLDSEKSERYAYEFWDNVYFFFFSNDNFSSSKLCLKVTFGNSMDHKSNVDSFSGDYLNLL